MKCQGLDTEILDRLSQGTKICISQGSPDEENQQDGERNNERQRDFKELTHMYVATVRSQGCRAGYAEDPEKSSCCRLQSKGSLEAELLPEGTSVFFT